MLAPTPPSRRRLWTFRILTGITALLLVSTLPNLLAPWLDVNLNPAVQHPELERWHFVFEGAGDAGALVILVALLLRPARAPVLVASLAISLVVGAVFILPFTGPLFLLILVPVALIVASYPYWRLLRVRREDIRPVRPLLVVGVLAAAALAAPVATSIRRQLAGVGEVATTNQAITYAEHLTTFALTGLLLSLALPGWRIMAGTAAASWIYLGAVAIALPTQPDSWGTIGGAAALVAGTVVGYAAITARRPVMSGTRGRLSAVAAVAGAALAVAAVASFVAAPPATAAAQPATAAANGGGGERLHLVAREGTITAIDLGKKGFGIGDVYVLTDRLYRDGHAVGRDAGTCTVVTAGGDSVCDVVLVLPAGHLVVHGLLPGDAHEIRLAVTGGTARYATARGEVLLRQGESSSTFDLRLAP
jgi:hypothetical protein